MYYLYYAGMADDQINEQIGLATSKDGLNFNRVNGSGLVLPRVPTQSWKSLRTCNPTVLIKDNKFYMFYQGISSDEPKHVSIGVASSNDGIHWDASEEAALTWKDMRSLDPEQDSSKRILLHSPGVVIEQGVFKMWFCYSHITVPGGTICYAESVDGHKWDIKRTDLLRASKFGNYTLQYPQIVDSNRGRELYFTLFDKENGAWGIFRTLSNDGLHFHGISQVLPHALDNMNQVVVERPAVTSTKIYASHDIKVIEIFMRSFRFAEKKWRSILSPNDLYFGYAHSHILMQDGRNSFLYYHGAHKGMRGLHYDIRRCDFFENRCSNHKMVLAPSRIKSDWDSFFVGDPFVVVV